MRLARGLEIKELVDELGERGDVVSEAIDDELGVRLVKMRNSGGSVEDAEEEGTVSWRRRGS